MAFDFEEGAVRVGLEAGHQFVDFGFRLVRQLRVAGFEVPLGVAQDDREDQPPRVGRAAQFANEEAALERMRFDSIKAVSFLVDGDRVAINYCFEMTLTGSGGRLRMDEVAYQLWRGDQIVSERYFFDPAQRLPIATSPS